MSGWLTATQTVATIGLILLLAGVVAIFLYMFIHTPRISKNKLIIAYIIIGFCAGNYSSLVFSNVGLTKLIVHECVYQLDWR